MKYKLVFQLTYFPNKLSSYFNIRYSVVRTVSIEIQDSVVDEDNTSHSLHWYLLPPPPPMAPTSVKSRPSFTPNTGKSPFKCPVKCPVKCPCKCPCKSPFKYSVKCPCKCRKGTPCLRGRYGLVAASPTFLDGGTVPAPVHVVLPC